MGTCDSCEKQPIEGLLTLRWFFLRDSSSAFIRCKSELRKVAPDREESKQILQQGGNLEGEQFHLLHLDFLGVEEECSVAVACMVLGGERWHGRNGWNGRNGRMLWGW